MALTTKHINTIRDALKAYDASLNRLRERNKDNTLIYEVYEKLQQDVSDAERAIKTEKAL